MLLLYRKEAGLQDDSKDHLHSTMLLLYPYQMQSKAADHSIYIPLCFYFIQLQMLQGILNQNLHSTMLLLYPVYRSRLREADIHLHSTMLLLYPQVRDREGIDETIYIPLCFYFIRIGLLSVAVCKLHLHSTMLLLYR